MTTLYAPSDLQELYRPAEFNPAYTSLGKRCLDVALTIAVAVALLPLLALVALAIRISSPGCAIFRQKRYGLNGEMFYIWKFRTMVPNAGELLHEYLRQNPEAREEFERDHKLRNDPRVTRLGRFLRRTSIDELPQLWNVLKGEMSLVGPRPLGNEVEIAKYGEAFGHCSSVRPGITGLWQVSGRNDTTYEQRVRLDSQYVNNWSILLDLRILFRTIPAIVKATGAY